MSNNRLFFDYLATMGITDPMKVHKAIYKLSILDYAEMMEKCYSFLETDFQPANSNFEFIASSTLSGEPFNNNDLIYRVYKILQLADFAILYSDVVWIRNPLEKYVHGIASIFDENGIQNFANDIFLLMEIRDLIYEGIIKIAATTKPFTKNELADIESNFPKNFRDRIKGLNNNLEEIFKDNLKFEVFEHEDELLIKFTASGMVENAIERREGVLNWTHVKDKTPKFLKKALKKESKLISKKHYVKSGLLEHFIYPIINDLSMQNWFHHGYGQNYITDREIDFELINKLNGQKPERNSQNITKGLRHALPTLKNVRVEELLKVRKNETDAFNVYRNSFNAILDNGKNLSEDELKEFIKDAIQPQIDKIQHALTSSKKTIKNKTAGEVVLGSAIFSAALFSGLVPIEYATGITSLAGFHNTYKIGKGLWDYKSSEDQIRNNDYYFLWKTINT